MQLYLAIAAAINLLLASAATDSAASVRCSMDSSTCTVEFQLEDKTLHQVELVPELVQDTKTKFTIDGKDVATPTLPASLKRYQTKPSAEFWGTALIENHQALVDAVFSTKAQGAIEFRDGKRVQVHASKVRRLNQVGNNEQKPCLVRRPPGDPEPSNTIANKLQQVESTSASAITEAPFGVLTPFFPGCYPGDTVPYTYKLNLAFDYQLVKDVTAGATSEADKMQRITRAADHLMSVGKLVYRQQLNLNIELVRITVGTATSQEPLSNNDDDYSCETTTIDSLDKMQVWIKNNPFTDAEYTMLVSGCNFYDAAGVAWINGACSRLYNSAVSVYNWRTFAHELGHAFGMEHSFENGQGKTGGIMDYTNDGIYNGVVQFHPYKYNEVCPHITNMINQKQCKFFGPVISTAACGNAFLEKNEECECLDGSTSCGACKNCKLTVSGMECSRALFAVRNANTEDMIAVGTHLLASPTCCTAAGKLSGARTRCGEVTDGVCGIGGTCVESPCPKYSMQSCDYDTAGCQMSCKVTSTSSCSFYFTDYFTKESIHRLGNGSPCLATGGSIGTCSAGACKASSTSTKSPTLAAPVTSKPTIKPTVAVTLKPTVKPTIKPTVAVTSKPTIKPTVAVTSKPTIKPTVAVTSKPSIKPTLAVTPKPTIKPTRLPTKVPSGRPTVRPTKAPVPVPTRKPTKLPTAKPSKAPTPAPTKKPTKLPTLKPTKRPTSAPTAKPSKAPSPAPTKKPSKPTTFKPSKSPTPAPTKKPTKTPTAKPTKKTAV